MGIIACSALLLFFWSASPARAESGRIQYYRALNTARQGQAERAREILAGICDGIPEDPYADDALAEMARLDEEVLAQPQRALEVYRRLMKSYPQSRLARRARARSDFLSKHLDQGGPALARYQTIVRAGASASADDSLRDMKALLESHPDFSLRPDGLIWMAGVLVRAGRSGEARKLLQGLIEDYPAHTARRVGLQQLARLELAEDELDGAQWAYELLAQESGGDWKAASEEGLRVISGLRWRVRLLFGAWVLWSGSMLALILGLVIVVRRKTLIGRQLIPPVESFLFLLTMIVLLFVVWGRANQTTMALFWMTGLVWPALVGNGLLLRAVRPARSRFSLWLLGLVVFWACSMYLSIAMAGMTDQVLHTLQFGTG